LQHRGRPYMTVPPSKRGPIAKISQSDSCKGGTVSLAVRQWYNVLSVGCHLWNVGTLLNNLQ